MQHYKKFHRLLIPNLRAACLRLDHVLKKTTTFVIVYRIILREMAHKFMKEKKENERENIHIIRLCWIHCNRSKIKKRIIIQEQIINLLDYLTKSLQQHIVYIVLVYFNLCFFSILNCFNCWFGFFVLYIFGKNFRFLDISIALKIKDKIFLINIVLLKGYIFVMV